MALLRLETELQGRGIVFSAVREPDLGDQLMAIGVQPQPRTPSLKKLFRPYELWK